MGYTASDLLGVGAGFLLFALFAFAPGYTFGWLTNVFEFRRRRLATRIAAAVPVSIALTPITAYFLWRCWLPLVWIVFGASGVLCAILLIRDVRTNKLHLSREGWIVATIAAGWVLILIFSLVDLQFGNRLYFPFAAYDNSTRAAVTAALARDGIPPHNPFFFAGQPAPLRYHYFWFIPCSLVRILGGTLVSARLSLIAGLAWCDLGLLAVIALYLRFFQKKGADQIERRTLIAIRLLAVTGLDILGILFASLVVHSVYPDLELWNEPVKAWISTMLWLPHDLAALIAGFTGFLLVWHTAGQEKRKQRIFSVLGGGLAFASAVGASIFVGITFAAACALWLTIALLKRWWRHGLLLAGAGMLAVALSAPYLLLLMNGVHGGTGGEGNLHTLPLGFTVRAFKIPDLGMNPDNPGKILALNAVLLPLNYFLEFGFFFVVGCLEVRRIWRCGLRDEAEWAAVALSTASLFICTFMKSTVISNNDLGWISALLVQYILLLCAAEMWNEGILGIGRCSLSQSTNYLRTAPRLITAILVLGVMGSCYELCLQRTYPILTDWSNVHMFAWLSLDHQLGRRTFELRYAYEEMDRILPASAVVQASPAPDAGDIPAELYSGRQMVADVEDCGTVFGGSKQFCDDVILPRIKPLFDDRQPLTAGYISDTCRQFSITALLFKDTDPVWKDQSSWIWKAHPLLSNRYVRVIECGGGGVQLNGSTHP